MKIFYILFFVFLSSDILAQIPPIDTDRPDQTESAFLVPKNWVRLEAGFNFEKSNSHEKEFLTPTLLSKYGLSKRVELRLITTIRTNSSLVIPLGTLNETGLDIIEL